MNNEQNQQMKSKINEATKFHTICDNKILTFVNVESDRGGK